MMRKVLSLSLALLLLVSAISSLAQEADDDSVWIDVRSAEEYKQGHIEGAINIPHADIGHKIGDYVSDLFIPVHLYDSNGTFAGLALELLMEMGFDYVVNEGSYDSLLRRQNAP
jgi:phage shock protein E